MDDPNKIDAKIVSKLATNAKNKGLSLGDYLIYLESLDSKTLENDHPTLEGKSVYETVLAIVNDKKNIHLSTPHITEIGDMLLEEYEKQG